MVEDFLVNIGSFVILVVAPLVSIILVISPFIIVRAVLKKRGKKFNTWFILLCFLLSVIILVIVLFVWYLFIAWTFDKIGEAFLMSF